MAKLSEDKIFEIIRVYKETGIYSKTAKIVGVSAATVKKYTSMNIEAPQSIIKNKFTKEVPPIGSFNWSKDNINRLGYLSEEEKKEIKELWEEL